MKWVLSSLTLHIPRQLFLIPLGTGETKQITHDLIDRGRARFFPDGKNVVFTGTEPGHKSRIYVQAIDSGTARPISPEGVSGFVPTPDGKFVFGFSDSVALYPVDGQGPPRPVPGIHPGEAIFSVSPDGRTALVGLLYGYAVDVMRVDLTGGTPRVVQENRAIRSRGGSLGRCAVHSRRPILCLFLLQRAEPPVFGGGIALRQTGRAPIRARPNERDCTESS